MLANKIFNKATLNKKVLELALSDKNTNKVTLGKKNVTIKLSDKKSDIIYLLLLMVC